MIEPGLSGLLEAGSSQSLGWTSLDMFEAKILLDLVGKNRTSRFPGEPPLHDQEQFISGDGSIYAWAHLPLLSVPGPLSF